MTFGCVVAAGAGLAQLRNDRLHGLVADPTGYLIAFLLNPLVLTAGVLGAHADVTLAAAFAWAMVLDQRRRPFWALLVLGVVSLVKAYAVVALLAYAVVVWRRGQHRPLVAGGVAVVALGVLTSWPYWQGLATLRPLLSTGDHASASLAGLVQNVLGSVLGHLGVASPTTTAHLVVRAASVVALAGLAVWVLAQPRSRREPWWVSAVLLGGFFVASPWFLPWYLLGLLVLVIPLTHPALRRAVVAATASMVVVLPLAHDLGQTLARYLPPLVAARWRRSSVSELVGPHVHRGLRD